MLRANAVLLERLTFVFEQHRDELRTDPGTAALSLTPDARQFVVLEAKLFARFSAGVRNAPYYDQAARTISRLLEE